MALSLTSYTRRADSTGLHDVGKLALWAVSSAKPGYGVENVKDANPATLWQ